MTFDTKAWAIDGPLLSSSLARRAQYAASNGRRGVVNADDLAVTPLATPGIGFRVAAGVALIRNGYQGSNINETYVASNDGVYTFPSAGMPASNPSAASYLVAIVIGDPEFSQVGHPWMGSGDPAVGTEDVFEYVRVTLIPCSSSTTNADGLGYPALALARIDIPSNTTTITSGMITDLRTRSVGPTVARLQKSGTQSIPQSIYSGGTWPFTKVTLTVADSHNAKDFVTSSSSIQVPESGWYLVTAGCRWTDAKTGRRILTIGVAGTAGATAWTTYGLNESSAIESSTLFDWLAGPSAAHATIAANVIAEHIWIDAGQYVSMLVMCPDDSLGVVEGGNTWLSIQRA